MNLAARTRRTGAAVALTVIAIAAPCVAWYVVGSASAEREATALRQRPLERGHDIARALADRLRGRLEAMRDSESQRPAYHFQPSYHDPTTTCQCASRTPSPLATGPRDPFVEIYFEIDGTGRLQVPVLGDLEGVTPDADRLQRAHELHDELAAASGRLVDMAHGHIGDLPAVSTVAASRAPRTLRTELPGLAARDALAADPVATDAFQWYGLELDARPLLVALRRVGPQANAPVQGFVLSPDAVDDWLRTAELPATLRPGRPLAAHAPDEAVADVQLDCTRWEIAVDVSEAMAEAEATAGRVEAGFVRSFAVGSGFAVLAGAAVIFLLVSTERMARQRSRFAAAAAHELRTPLSGLRLYGEMLGGALDDREKSRRYARRIAEESERLSRVVTNVLGFTRLERGGVQVHRREGDLAAALREVVERLRPAVEGNGARLELDLGALPRGADGLPTAGALYDPDALDPIVQNLVDNAEKYGREATDRRITVSLVESGDRLALRVRDRGPGVSPRVAGELFHPFRRGEHPDQPAGLGLGLPLVDALARAHGAPPRWRNCEDGGAEFTVVFERPRPETGPEA